MPLKGYDRHGRRVVLMRGNLVDPARHSLSDQMRFTILVKEVEMDRLDQFTITGMVGIEDMSGLTLAHAAQVSPAVTKKGMTVLQVIEAVML